MPPSTFRCIAFSLVFSPVIPLTGLAQSTPPAARPAAIRIEPGLENAVQWKWWVAPSDEKDWGIPLPEPEPALAPAGTAKPGNSTASSGDPLAARPDRYTVQRGDALAVISRKFGMTVAQLKTFNTLTTDIIKVGQILRIPTPEEIRAMAPPPPPPEPKKEETKAKGKSKEPAKPQISFEATREMESVRLQALLDREGFSPGPITNNPGLLYDKALQLYRSVHEEVQGAEPLREKALQIVGDPFTRYVLKREDFRFISPPKAERADEPPATPSSVGTKRSTKSKSKTPAIPLPPPPKYDELTSTTMLAYRTPWEFVAERYHCDEAFLRNLNLRIKTTPVVGTEFQVPNVVPFEIEKAFDPPLQPQPDDGKPITAAIADLSRIEVRRGDALIATAPMSLARPDLRGRGAWTVLDVIARPRLGTRQEEKDKPKPKTNLFTSTIVQSPDATEAAPKPVLSADQFIAPGPNNPAGILWINLAKAKTTEPLPYGLHGTSIPGQMKTQESIGGLRLTNWDIARIVRLLPAGTPLQWK